MPKILKQIPIFLFLICFFSFSSSVFAQEATPSAEVSTTPTPELTSTPTIEPTITPEPILIPESTPSATLAPEIVPEATSNTSLTPIISTWKDSGDGSWQTVDDVVVDKEYVAQQNDKVKIKFTKLPNPSGKITIKEIKLSVDQVRQTEALSDTAYDISSTMENGTFEYTLTLPTSTVENVEVKSSEDGQVFVILGGVTAQTDTLTITGLNHFTIFVVTTPISDTSQSVVINEALVHPTDGSKEWVELYNTTDNAINLAEGNGWKIKDAVNSTISLSSLGTLPAKGLVVFEHNEGWLNNTRPETVIIFDGSGNEVNRLEIGAAGGVVVAHYPAQGESVGRTIDGGGDWAIFSSPTKGWFNSATVWTCDQLNGTGSPATPPTLASIAICLSSGSGIVTNMGTLTDLSAATNLSFEKRTNVADLATAVGKIVFTGPLNLSDQNTVNYLKIAGQKLDMAASGGEVRVGLNTIVSGATESSFKTAAATITMYGLSTIHSAPNLVVKNNSGTVILSSDTGSYPTITGVGGVAGFDDTAHAYTFTTNHFTTFETDSTAPTLSLVNISSNNVTTAMAKVGDTVTVNFTSSENIQTPTVTIAGHSATVSGNNASWSAIYTMVSGDTEGVVPFTINFTDIAGNAGTTINTATNSSSVTFDKTIPTITKLGDDSMDVILSAGDTSLVFSEVLSDSSKTTIQNALTAGADKTITYTWIGATLTIQATETTTFTNDVVVSSVLDIAGNSAANLLIVDSKLDAAQTTPNGSGNATSNSTTPQVVVTNPTQPVDITIDPGTTDPTIDLNSFITDGTGTIPQITINSDNADVAIPASTTITSADSFWNGVIAAPTVTTVILPETSGETKTLSTAIEVGFTGAKLSFDKGVRILLPGQAGKRAGYIRTGIDFTEITSTCAADN